MVPLQTGERDSGVETRRNEHVDEFPSDVLILAKVLNLSFCL